MDDVFKFEFGEKVTCPDCGSDCELSHPQGGVAECQGCMIAFNFKIDISCPLCQSENTKPDQDFPHTMMNCNTCGAEWNHMEVTLNPAKV